MGVSISAGASGGPLAGVDLLSGAMKNVPAGEKGTVVVFLSARCPCSESHTAILKAMALEFNSFAFVAVHANLDEPEVEARAYFEKLKLPFPVLEDRGQKLLNEYKALKTPHVFLLSPEGKLLFKGGVTSSSHGPSAERNFLREALVDVLAGQTVRTPEGRTLGCEIKRRKNDAW